VRDEGKTGGRRAIYFLKNLGGFAPSRETNNWALVEWEEAHTEARRHEGERE
jgi:hypothetical protein